MPKAPASKAPPAEPASYEAALEELEQLVGRIEAGQLPLEEMLAGYQRGATRNTRMAPAGIAPAITPPPIIPFPTSRQSAGLFFLPRTVRISLWGVFRSGHPCLI